MGGRGVAIRYNLTYTPTLALSPTPLPEGERLKQRSNEPDT